MKRFAAVLFVCLAGCSRDVPQGAAVVIRAPLGLPALVIPAGNRPTGETVRLGRKLFYEKRLSVDDSVSCASCHAPETGFADRRGRSVGVGGKSGTRNAPTVLNAAYSPRQFWDGRAGSLEEQAGGPIANPVEMNLPHAACAAKLNGDAGYRAAFERAFGPGPVTMERIRMALASFERTLVSGNSAFDRYRYGGDVQAMNAAAIRGLAVFTDAGRGNCAVCHPIGAHDALFTDGKFHNTGSGVNGEGELTDVGRYAETKSERDRGAFKTPTLRSVALTAPYMHDGSLQTLKQVVDFYTGGGNSNAHLDPEMKKIRLKAQERRDLVDFLEALTGEMPAASGPLP